ncbi:protein transport protein Sec16B-like isoform X2 [Bufo bufo]|uniref:protein transport protein Sec16B-like isoform X2 n=1 Tax=Bufo bufo TaxID=8384 RepID=UPI001ABE9952|nr:protein transport protein Sec16B-like isoform X2 [Bufo bufo]
MDHGPPYWFKQSHARPPADMGHWRGEMCPPPPPYHHKHGDYGYYSPYLMQGGHQAWPGQWMDYYSQHPATTSRYIDHRRPASRAEVYDRSEAYRPLSRQGYDERYGFYEAVQRENYGNRDYNYEPPVGVSGEKDGRRGMYNNQIEHWGQNSASTSAFDQNMERGHPQRDAHRLQRYENDSAWHPAERRCDSAVDRLESFSSTEPSLLSQYRDSGMSSSSYELSQYMQDPADLIDSWNPLQDDTLEQTPQPTAPMKFSLPHVSVCFGAQGQLIRVCPNFPNEGQPALVEIHSMEILLHDTSEQEEMRGFPGPVQREDLHKVDVMNYCQQNVSQCLHSQGARSRDNALLWQVLLQMCRQNGCIDGSDLADLILQDCKRERYRKEQEYSELISLGDEPSLIPDGAQVDLLTGEIPSTVEMSKRAVEKFTKLLYFGRKKEALDWAMKSQLWGHALFLSSKMDSRTYSWVMARFTSTLAVNDPLQTLFQLMTGRIPQAATCSGDKKWGDWRPHLAVMLSNQMSDPEVNHRAIITMGDNLVLKGFTEAGHCCYLTAGISLGKISEKSDRLVLLGSNQNQKFRKFASTANIQRTEILEYCQSLGKISHFIPSFQVYKFVFAARLVDYGLTSVALHYCECIASAILLSNSGSLVLISELIKLSERLKYSDPQILEQPEPEQNQEPTWLVQLRSLFLQLQVNSTSGRTTLEASEDQGNNTEPNKTPPTSLITKCANQWESSVILGSESSAKKDVSPVNEVQPVSQDHDTRGGLQKMEAERVYDTSWVPPNRDPQPVEPQGENYFEWGIQQPVSIMDPYSGYKTYDEPQEKENLEEISDSPSPSSSFSNNALMMKNALMSRRVSTVSETSTISVGDDDNDEDRSGDEAPVHKTEEKKGSSSGWFSWFRSKPAKETAVPPREAKVPPKSQTHPPVGHDQFRPPPSSYQLPASTSEARYAGIKETEEPQKIGSFSVSSEFGVQQESMGTYPNVPGGPMNQPTAAIPFYNPAQR